MPQVVNGCGTWYYGKNRVHRIPMTCPHCGAYADLESYDTTKYIVFLFVPLVPLSKWRVLEKCPVCTKHRALKLKDWEKAKQADSAAVTEELRRDSSNPETIQKVIGVATGYQDENLFLQVAERLAKPMTGNAEVQAMLGAAYAYFSRRDQAEGAFKASLAVKDDPAVREQLALQLLRQGRPEEAEQHLQHALNSNSEEHSGFVHLLAEGYLAGGQTERGIALLDKATTMNPAIKADKQHQKLRKQAEKSRGTGRPIPSPLLTPSKKEGYEEGGVGGNVAAWIGPLVALVLLAFYLSFAWSAGKSREVHVVSGLDVPYTATIAGQTVELQPRGRRTVKVPEGTLHVSAEADGKPVVDTNVDVSTSFFLRPFLSRTFVINPDRTALISWEKQYYAENAANAPEGEYDLFVGDPLYMFKSIDYEFQAFPLQITTSGSGSIAKTRVALVPPQEVTDTNLMFLLSQMLNEDQYRDYIETRARFTPDDEKWVQILQGVMPTEEYLAFLSEGLADRPLHIHWHRAYQSTMEREHPERDLQAEYQAYLDADPDDADLMYLVGRVTDDVDEAMAFYRRAVEAQPPSAFAANAMAFQLISEGRFEDAEPLIEQAVAAAPDSLMFDSIYRTVKLATGQYDDLIAKAQARNDQSLGGMVLVSQVVELLGYQGDGAAARQEIDRYFREQAADGDGEFAQTMRDAMLTSLAYAEGDVDTFLQRHADNKDPNFDVLFVRGDLDAAAAAITDENHASTEAAASHLAVFLRAQAAGNQELADRELAAGIDALQKGTSEERAYADALGPNGVSDPDRLLRLAVFPEYKRVILAALGARHPDHKDQYFALARKLNFERTIPWAFLKEFLGE